MRVCAAAASPRTVARPMRVDKATADQRVLSKRSVHVCINVCTATSLRFSISVHTPTPNASHQEALDICQLHFGTSAPNISTPLSLNLSPHQRVSASAASYKTAPTDITQYRGVECTAS